MIAIVTGYSGLIGSELLVSLDRRGWTTRTLTDGAGDPLDVRDARGVDEAVARAAPEAIFHLGGISGPMVAPGDPARVTEVNAVGTVNVLEAARRNRVRRFVYAASVSGYDGGSADDPVPRTVYGATKRFSEMVAGVYHEQHGIETVCARIGAVYGRGRTTVEVLDQMMIDARERGRVRYARHGVLPLISAHDAAECLARLGEIPDPPRDCELYTQLVTQRRLAGMVADAFGLPESDVVETPEGPAVLPALSRIMYPHLLLDDEVQLLPDALHGLL